MSLPEKFRYRSELQLSGWTGRESFSGSEYAFLWTADSLESALEWQKVRLLAKECLRIFGGL